MHITNVGSTVLVDAHCISSRNVIHPTSMFFMYQSAQHVPGNDFHRLASVIQGITMSPSIISSKSLLILQCRNFIAQTAFCVQRRGVSTLPKNPHIVSTVYCRTTRPHFN